MTWEEFCAACIPEPYTVTVEARTGTGAHGDVFAAPVPVELCVIENTTRMVVVQTADAEGSEQLSSTTVYCPLTATVTPGSRVTLPWGPPRQVLAVTENRAHGHQLPEHLEFNLE